MKETTYNLFIDAAINANFGYDQAVFLRKCLMHSIEPDPEESGDEQYLAGRRDMLEEIFAHVEQRLFCLEGPSPSTPNPVELELARIRYFLQGKRKNDERL